MANWKKLVVSGSSITQLANDAGYISSIGGGIVSSSAQITLGGDLSGTADNAQLGSGVVGTTELANLAVTSGKIAAGAITADKLASAIGLVSGSSQITLGGSLSGTADNASIAAGAVGTTELSASSVTTAKIVDGAITNAKVAANAAISYTKLDLVGSTLLSGSGAVTAVTDSATVDLAITAGTLKADIVSGSIANNALANSSLTVSAGSGLIGGGSVSLGGSTTVSLDGAGSLNNDTLTKWDGSKLVNSNITDDGTAINLVGDATFQNDVVISGNLQVAGTASFVNVEELSIKDKFITLASGSNSLTDAGFIFQSSTTGAGSGPALFIESTSTGTYGRMAMATSVNTNASSATPAAYVATAETTAGAPSSAPTFGGSSTGFGNIHVDSSTGDIYIYA
jgi:hypothetical protein